MSAQLELDLKRRRAAAPVPAEPVSAIARARRIAGAILAWTPVWVPFVFLAQLLVLGLRPTLAEGARLDRAESEVRARATALEVEQETLSQEARMLEDDVFRERVRRSLVDPTAAPLTLERARAARP